MAKRIPGINQEWSNYLTCILLHMLLPLLPLLFEAWALGGSPSESTLAITAAIYAMSIGLSSENKAMFGLCIMVGVIFSAVYGQVSVSKNPTPDVGIYAALAILFVFVIHAAERYNRHVVDCRPFLDFTVARA